MTFDAITEALHERADKALRDKINNQVDQFFDGISRHPDVLDMTVPPESILHFLTKINPYEPILVTNNISFKDLAEMLKNALFEAMKDAARKKEVSIFIYNIERGYIGPAREQAPIIQEAKQETKKIRMVSKEEMEEIKARPDTIMF